ncbi:phosphotransferase enzyme family protein [Thiorhodococcus fuscus]|uniref:Phosphotransferase enzyme family protein n=1 Tax=Thiorhodococcus fuscus TaxID=527200 RepID=A0ABW4YE65_9GAMM
MQNQSENGGAIRHDGTSLRAIAAEFDISAPIDTPTPLGQGLINDTFRLDAGGLSYVLQRINGAVFPRPEQIMANLLMLSDFLRERGATAPRVPTLILARGGLPFVRDGNGHVWRLMELIAGTRTLSRIAHPDQAAEVGRILGGFHRALSELPTERLGISLPGFHDTPGYLRRFTEVSDLRPDIPPDVDLEEACTFVAERRELANALEQARDQGQLPTRITHGDPKLDNILFSADERAAVALIDLDTVQPGLVHHDLGDCLRSCCNRCGEGMRKAETAEFDLGICAGILAGYAEGSGHLLQREEVGLLYEAVRVVPFELGLRFLTDHLEGDRYFRVDERGRNLLKARVQFALVRSIERQEREIRAVIEESLG